MEVFEEQKHMGIARTRSEITSDWPCQPNLNNLREKASISLEIHLVLDGTKTILFQIHTTPTHPPLWHRDMGNGGKEG